jgi:Domain of unknown function (DUF6484)
MNTMSSPGTSAVNVAQMLLDPGTRPVDFVSVRSRPEGMIEGRIEGFDESGLALVTWPSKRDDFPQAAQTTVPLGQRDLGREVILAFVTVQEHLQPVIMGLIQKPVPLPPTESAPAGGWDVQTDGKRMVLSAQEEIVLRCGQASITLTRAGKVLLQGDYLSSRSSGVNRIKGGSVQIN